MSKNRTERCHYFFLFFIIFFLTSCAHESLRYYSRDNQINFIKRFKESQNIDIYYTSEFRKDQKEPVKREQIFEEILKNSLNSLNCKNCKIIGKVESFEAFEKLKRDVNSVHVFLVLQEFGPYFYLTLLPPGWESTTDISLQVYIAANGEMERHTLFHSIGGLYLLRGMDALNEQLQSLIKDQF